MSATIASLYRYPVKGLSPQTLETVSVKPGETFPFDRAYALEAGKRRFDPGNPKHLPKVAFLMLMRDERLALLDTAFDEATQTLTISRDGARVAEGRLDDPIGRKVVEQFFAAFMGESMTGLPHIVSSPGHSFSDVAAKCVSLINLATVRDIARVSGRTLDPRRFRGNVYLEGIDPWAEFDLLDRTIRAGDVRLQVFARIDRCAAINVNPETGDRDTQLPRLMQQSFGHIDCGLYARVETGGALRVGDTLTVEAS